jgi:hypothetical protein
MMVAVIFIARERRLTSIRPNASLAGQARGEGKDTRAASSLVGLLPFFRARDSIEMVGQLIPVDIQAVGMPV